MATYLPTTTLYLIYLSPFSSNTIVVSSSASERSWKSVHSLWTRVALPLLSTLFSLIGATALILLTIFDTARYPSIHRSLLSASIITHIFGCAVLCSWTRLQIRQHIQLTSSNNDDDIDKVVVEVPALPISRLSLFIKSILVAAEFVVVVLFAIMTWFLKTFDTAAIMEWAVVLMFAAYMACLIGDLWVLGRVRVGRQVEEDMPVPTPIGVAV